LILACPIEPDDEPSTPVYTITFNTHDGSPVEAITGNEGEKVEQPDPPTRVGYTFLGWFGAETDGTPYEWPYTLTANVTMHAQWKANNIPQQVTLTFDAHDGSPVVTIAGNVGETVEQPPDPIRVGFTFQGWYSAETGGTRYSWPQTLSVSVTMHARWRDVNEPPPAQYTLSFDVHGGSETVSITGSEDDPVIKPPDPTRPGYAFTGWYSAETGGIRYAWPHTLEADLTMHAQWWNSSTTPPDKYAITFDTHGGSVVDTIAGYAGETVAQPPDPSRTGYGFTGWFSAASGGTRYAWPRVLNSNLTMHAQWWDSSKPPPARYTITFDSGGGSAMEAIAGNAGEILERPANPAWEGEGYAFDRWTNTNGGNVSWPYTLHSDVTMQAQWKLVSYTITYNLNGGANAEANPGAYTIESEAIALAAPARTSYDFGGWHDNEACEGDAVTLIPKGSTGNKTFWAAWTPRIYAITYELNGGANDPANPGTYTIESGDITLADPTRTGYYFEGWHDKQSAGNRVERIPRGNAGDITLWAQWSAGGYAINYELNGGTNATGNPRSYRIDSADITLADPTRPGYDFGGWHDNEACEGTAIALIRKGSTGDKTFWAAWTPTIYTITYELGGGTNAATNPGTYTIESDDITLAAPGRTGYSFDGWHDKQSSGNKVERIPKGSVGNRTLWAQWHADDYTITYNLNGGTNATGNPRSYRIDSADITLADPTRPGYDFGGWHDNEACEGTAVALIRKGSTGDKTFWAAWTPTIYTITYELGGGTNAATNPATYTIESDAITLDDPDRTGYRFSDWSRKDGSSDKDRIPKGSTGNKTFTASWSIISYAIAYNLNGGTNATGNPGFYKIDSDDITLAAPTRTGYDFGGWHDNEACEGDAVALISKGSWGDKTFWAKWIPTTYTITYNNLYDGINVTNPKSYTIESDDITLAAPVRPDCNFEGWHDRESNGTRVDAIPKGSTGDKIFWATWTVNSSSQPIVLSIKVIDQADGAFKLDEKTFELAKPGGKKTITVAETDAGRDFVWHIGLLPIGTGKSVTLSAANLTLGTHTLRVTAEYEGALYSKEIKFTVK
jgi:uncharacterized repeat protein (TIGR02543 family)